MKEEPEKAGKKCYQMIEIWKIEGEIKLIAETETALAVETEKKGITEILHQSGTGMTGMEKVLVVVKEETEATGR